MREIIIFCKRCRNRISMYVNFVRLRIHRIDFGKHCVIHGKFYIHLFPTARMKIGDNFYCSSGWNINALSTDTYSHNLNYIVRRGQWTDWGVSKPIVIEDDVMIGVNCIILKGVTIGSRSIVAAGSVVTKSFPSDCIIGGNPAKLIRKLEPI